jgi:hypothetical protein
MIKYKVFTSFKNLLSFNINDNIINCFTINFNFFFEHMDVNIKIVVFDICRTSGNPCLQGTYLWDTVWEAGYGYRWGR